ncbi:hypothetical protein [Bacillus altitudinis]|uniref:hypothetical protein n=2 Tax=Bacillus altitudinis TaxID=293387 RepID=UPI003080E658
MDDRERSASVNCHHSQSISCLNPIYTSVPKKQFAKMDRPYGMFVGSKDELFDVETVLPYHELPKKRIKKQSVYQVLEGYTHLSILLEVGKQIGRTI